MTTMTIDGEEVFFMRSDGELAEGAIGTSGEDENGEVIFFEIRDSLRPKLGGKNLYQRIIIRRVFPCIRSEK